MRRAERALSGKSRYTWQLVEFQHVVCRLYLFHPQYHNYCSEGSVTAVVLKKNTDKDHTGDTASVNKAQKQTKPVETKEEKVWCLEFIFQNIWEKTATCVHDYWKWCSASLHFSLLLTSLAEWWTPRQARQVYVMVLLTAKHHGPWLSLWNKPVFTQTCSQTLVHTTTKGGRVWWIM